MENKITVELLNANVYDFKTNDGSLIKGLKIYYYDNVVKDGSITGNIENSFFSSDKIENFKEVFEELKKFYYDKKKNGQVPYIMLSFEIKSINSKPVITKIDLKK